MMFAYIRGTLIQSTMSFAIVETGGIGYKIFLPANVFGKLPQIGKEASCTLHL